MPVFCLFRLFRGITGSEDKKIRGSSNTIILRAVAAVFEGHNAVPARTRLQMNIAAGREVAFWGFSGV